MLTYAVFPLLSRQARGHDCPPSAFQALSVWCDGKDFEILIDMKLLGW